MDYAAFVVLTSARDAKPTQRRALALCYGVDARAYIQTRFDLIHLRLLSPAGALTPSGRSALAAHENARQPRLAA